MRVFITLIAIALLSGCATLPRSTDQNLTVGSVQREVRIGMSGAEVAEALGSPNIVITDETATKPGFTTKSQLILSNRNRTVPPLRSDSWTIGVRSLQRRAAREIQAVSER